MSDIEKLEFIYESLARFFGGDVKKMNAWLKTSNLQFGGTSPYQLIMSGRVNRVYQFVKAAEAENGPSGL